MGTIHWPVCVLPCYGSRPVIPVWGLHADPPTPVRECMQGKLSFYPSEFLPLASFPLNSPTPTESLA